jgi:Fur family transcriptional regulator, ferric uptake regulator
MTEHEDISVDDANDLLKSVGLRKTFTRINLLQCLGHQTTPLTHPQVVERLSSLGFDSSTVFRGLSDLVDAGIVYRLDLGDRIWRYELRETPSSPGQPTAQHPHVVCRVCGRIECLELHDHRPEYRRLKDWRIDEVLFKGTCHNCVAEEATDEHGAEGRS